MTLMDVDSDSDISLLGDEDARGKGKGKGKATEKRKREKGKRKPKEVSRTLLGQQTLKNTSVASLHMGGLLYAFMGHCARG